MFVVMFRIIGLVHVGRGEGASCCLAEAGRGDGCLCPWSCGSWGIFFSAEISAGGSVLLLPQRSAVSSFLFILFGGSKYGFTLRKWRRLTFCFWSWGIKLYNWLAEHVKLSPLFYFLLFGSWCVPTYNLKSKKPTSSCCTRCTFARELAPFVLLLSYSVFPEWD